MRVADLPERKLTVDEFLDWTEHNPDSKFEFDEGSIRDKSDVRFELYHGIVVAMTPERVVHVNVKAECWLALRNALQHVNSHCRAYSDGIGVRIDGNTMFEPDGLVRCGELLPPETREVTDPLLVVEVLSPSTRSKDLGEKLEGYFTLSSLHHYLIVDPDRHRIIHHQRQPDSDGILTRIYADGAIHLAPPGIEISVDNILPPSEPEE